MKLLIACFLFLILFLATFDITAVNGIVPLIQTNFKLNDAQSATLQTAPSTAHSVALVLVWMLGDSIDRRKLFLTSLSVWIGVSLLAVLLGSESFVVLVIFRTLAAGISSTFIVLVQVILADLFHDRALGIAMMCMATCALLSGGLSGIVSSWIVSSGVPWQTGLVAGPFLASIPLLSLTCMTNSFRSRELADRSRTIGKILSSAFRIFANKSFVLMTLGISFGMIQMNPYMFWFPSMILYAWTSAPEAYLGLSYTTVITLWSSLSMIVTLLGLPVITWLVQSWYHGTGLFSGRKEYRRAYPVASTLCTVFVEVSFVFGMQFALKSYPVSVVSLSLYTMFGIAQSSLGLQMMLMMVPNGSRAAAVSMIKLISGLTSTPSSQLFGMISDAIRGDSMLPFNRFRSYQIALLFSFPFLILATVCNLTMVFTFSGDVRRSQDEDKKDEKTSLLDEKTSLIWPSKDRSESILDAIVRSRATTLTSVNPW